MTEVYFFRADLDHFAGISPFDASVWELMDEFDGTPFQGDWPRPEMDFDPDLPLGDFPYLASNVPVASPQAWEVLQPRVGEVIQALPLDVAGEEYQALNVLDVVDCLDLERAELRKIDGRVVGVRRWALREEAVEGHDVFKARYAERQVALVSEALTGWVRDATLAGARFDPVSQADEGTLE